MRTIGITGHTKGIGLELSRAFISKGDVIVGYSRSNDFDVSKPNNIDRIAFSMNENDCDIAILNAQYGYTQVQLLYKLDEMWKNESNKTIITISSISADGIKAYPHPYAVFKAALDKAVEQLQACRPYRLINIRPGYVDTQRVSDITEPKLHISDIVSTVMFCVDMPINALIRNITITPR